MDRTTLIGTLQAEVNDMVSGGITDSDEVLRKRLVRISAICEQALVGLKAIKDVYYTKSMKVISGADFVRFTNLWDAFAYKYGKADAAEAFMKSLCSEAMTQGEFNTVLRAAQIEAQRRPELIAKGMTPKMLQGWITSRRWEDIERDRIMQSSLNLDE